MLAARRQRGAGQGAPLGVALTSITANDIKGALSVVAAICRIKATSS
jgi:hypothetical protein